MRCNDRNPKLKETNPNMSSSNALASSSGVDKVSSYTISLKKNISEFQNISSSVIKELEKAFTTIETLEKELERSESEKRNLVEKISTQKKFIENSLAEEKKMTIKLQARDEIIKSQAAEIKMKEDQLNAQSNDFGQRLANYFAAIVEDISNTNVTAEPLINLDSELDTTALPTVTSNGNKRTNIADSYGELMPEHGNSSQTIKQVMITGYERNNGSNVQGLEDSVTSDITALDATTQPTITSNGNKRTNIAYSYGELMTEHGNRSQTIKRLKRDDSTPPETSSKSSAGYERNSGSNVQGLDDSVTSDIIDDSIETPTVAAVIECITSEEKIFSPQDSNPIADKKRNCRKNIRKVADFEDLAIETRSAYQREKERRTRCAKRLQTYNQTYGQLPGEVNELGKLVLDFDPNTKEELLTVDDKLSKVLKPYQLKGVKFMFDACFESIETLKGSGGGGGCILAHCMGLGKTLQVIALVHTLLSNHSQTNVKKVLIICPVNVIYNWKNEFDIWLQECKKIQIHELFTCRPNIHGYRMQKWHKEGGVLLIGYDMFRRLNENVLRMETTAATEMDKEEMKKLKLFQKYVINPGADLVVCDEGHLLKNPNSRLSKAVNKISTLRRIVLTGTPLQNNLSEYFCMVEFVKPRLLGTKIEFQNGFKNPIENGQYSDSKDEDIYLMQLRSHIVNKLLHGCVQRLGYSVLNEFLPPKREYVLLIRLTDVQIALYKLHLAKFQTSRPIVDFPNLRKICNHPKVLVDFDDRKVKNYPENDSEDDSDNSEALCTTSSNGMDKHEWWTSLCKEDKLNEIESSGKMIALFAIISECEALGDKLLVFSSCLSTLNVIEQFLSEVHKKRDPKSSGFKGSWTRDIDYLRLDGSKSIEARSRDISRFNSKTNLRARLFLLSTKAGGIGINLVAANRVVIFDAAWNPANDIQSIFRTYRIGQTKECYVYRFISLGTMEEKIYDRQITKLSLAKRVIDEHQVGRHFKENDLRELYSVDNLQPPNERPHINPNERILNKMTTKHPDLIYNYLDHDSLLEDKVADKLTTQEKKDAWDDFKNTLQAD